MKRKLFLPFAMLLCASVLHFRVFADDLKIVVDSADAKNYYGESIAADLAISQFTGSCFTFSSTDTSLVFRANGLTGGKARVGYVPFKISNVTVPAYTKRTYNLTFTLGKSSVLSGNNVYSYMEVIQGDVPSKLNTSSDGDFYDTDTSTSGTKFRLTTVAGSIKTDSIILSYTVDNLDGSSAKTFSFPGFVFMGGHRLTTLIDSPTFTLTFSGAIDYSKDEYKVLPTATHCSTASGAELVSRENAYSATFTADSYYQLPESISVSVGGSALSSSDYTWNKSTGVVSVPASQVTSYIEISVVAEPNVYSITYDKKGGTNDGTPATYTYSIGATLPDATKIKRTGYTFNGWYASEDFSGTAVAEVSATDHDDKTFYAKWTAIEYTITLEGNLGDNDGEKGTASITSTIEKTISLTDTDTKWVKTGHTLLGWCTQEDLSDDTPITQISKTYYAGGVTLYAKWSDHVYDVLENDDTHHWRTCKCNEIDPAGKTTHLGHYDSWYNLDTPPHCHRIRLV